MESTAASACPSVTRAREAPAPDPPPPRAAPPTPRERRGRGPRGPDASSGWMTPPRRLRRLLVGRGRRPWRPLRLRACSWRLFVRLPQHGRRGPRSTNVQRGHSSRRMNCVVGSRRTLRWRSSRHQTSAFASGAQLARAAIPAPSSIFKQADLQSAASPSRSTLSPRHAGDARRQPLVQRLLRRRPERRRRGAW